ncbi:MAG: hypothetical protein OJF51_002429 [Nitrospira sp.]|nr:MAG: hypothetical protein OJF51_002429 [Nitrospira sp.]
MWKYLKGLGSRCSIQLNCCRSYETFKVGLSPMNATVILRTIFYN